MARLFGTDGVRGIANSELTCELAFRLGQAGAYVLASDVHRPTILVGRDTRISGEMLESAMVAGICSMGARAVLVEVLPTPAIAYLTRYYEADAGVVISASHNTVEYNGIKFFDKNGYKLPDAMEDRMEEIALSGMPTDLETPVGERVGRPVRQRNATRRYVDFVKETTSVRLDGLHVVLDCAQGASFEVAPLVFKELGARVSCYYHEPDGTNINDNCGSTHPRRLCELVRELGADVGFAFDGDADRLMAVDERGQLINGDQVMAMLAIALKDQGRLRANTVVATVMSNMGLEIAMKKHGIKLEKTKVGDRYVLEKMLSDGFVLGGEQSGHVIMLDYNTTGDGLVTAVQLISAMVKAQQPLSRLAAVM
ncbi:MAG: phosphoglucosamine mutase, partial [Clostridia bacterium]